MLIPDAGSRSDHDWTLDRAVPMLEKAARGKVEGLVGGPEAFESVKAAVEDGQYDEMIISTLPRRASRWLRADLPRRVERLGVPISVIMASRDPKSATDSRLWANMPQGWH